jgi:PAS domain S-box-containing protein
VSSAAAPGNEQTSVKLARDIMSSIKRRILIVDDNPAIYTDFRKILCADKYEISALEASLFGDAQTAESGPSFELDYASQGQEALQLVSAACSEGRPYVMAFIDVRMPPGWDGIETTARIWEVDPRLQVVICTAHSDYSWEQMATQLKHADQFVILRKPFDVVEATQLANAFTEKWRLQQEVEERTKTLEESERQYHFLVETIPGMVLVWTATPEGKIDYANERLQEYSGKPFAESKGDGWQGIVHPEDLPRCLDQWTDSIQSGRPYQVEYRLRRACDGSYRWHLGRAVPMRNETAEILRWVGTSVDIEDQKRAEETLRQTHADLEKRVAERTQDLLAKTALFEALVDSSLEGILVVDDQGHRVLQNQRFIDMMKVPRHILEQKADEGVLQHVVSLNKYPEQFLEKVKFLYAHPTEISRDEVEFKDGMVLDRYTCPVVGKDGKCYGRIWAFRDISERKQFEQQLAIERDMLQGLMDNLPDFIYFKDTRSRFLRINRAHARFLGLANPGEVVGKTNVDFFPSHFSRQNMVDEARMMITGEPVLDKQENLKTEAGELWVSTTKVPMRDKDGHITGLVGVSRNITERKQAEKEQHLMEIQLRQAQKLESIGQLAAGIAHEINTPTQYVGDNTRFLKDSFQSITGVLRAYEELLQAAKNNAVTPELLARVEELLATADLAYLFEQIPAAIKETLEGIERVTKIVRAMKEFSHPGGKEKAAADVNKAIETTVAVARNEWKYVADMELELAPDLPAVPCFLDEFNQSILNLVVNASHAIGDAIKSQPGAKGKITIRTRREGDHVEVRVSDTGTGIPEAARPRIFEPFFTTKDVGKGTGQGLTIVYTSIVKKHGGTVKFETETGKGTTFILGLPLGPPQPQKEGTTK